MAKSLDLRRMSKIQVYFVPGMAAGKEIFRNISLPEDRYQIHILEWRVPEKKDSLASYAERMAGLITEPDPILIGVSFGGVLAQEMSMFLKLRKLIIISSVKLSSEMPKRFRFVRSTGAYRLVPTSLVLSAPDLRKFAVGPRSKKRLTLYQEYLSVRDKQYLDWAIKQMVCWDRKEAIKDVVHIHGDRDIVFPIRNIKDAIILPGGTHVMIVNKGRWISQKLIEIIENI